jgi:hypothetical protein
MKIRKLEWVQENPKCVAAEASDMGPGRDRYSIIATTDEPGCENLYWAVWDLLLPGTKDLQSLKDIAQALHEANVRQVLEKWVE